MAGEINKVLILPAATERVAGPKVYVVGLGFRA
jgi:hypothetical protein